MSIIQKVLEAERKRSENLEPKKRSLGQATKDVLSSTGVFKRLSWTRIEPQAMERNRILPEIEDRSAITAYKMLRTRVLQRMRSNNWRTLIVTGAGPGEGKTLTATNLALSIASDVNQSVILIDLDLQRPSIAKYFGLEVEYSIGDYLTGDVNLNDIAYAPEGIERLVVMPNRDPVPNSSELLASPKMRGLTDWLQQQGPETVAIFDMPPVLACDDVLAFSPYADAILLVVSEGTAERSAVSRTMEMIADRDLLGVVLNRSREKGSVSSYY